MDDISVSSEDPQAPSASATCSGGEKRKDSAGKRSAEASSGGSSGGGGLSRSAGGIGELQKKKQKTANNSKEHLIHNSNSKEWKGFEASVVLTASPTEAVPTKKNNRPASGLAG
jgi:hypothetical protein